jgi:hypothetical protein
MVVCALSISRLTAAGGVGTIKIKGNRPTEFGRLGPVVHADPAMELRLAWCSASTTRRSSTS